ncbi:MAG: nucleotidyltransferase family protein [Candidatus Omnitrophica bacterium]|nr:nucleotidyltransferase family protein [Candidatus Omnitrophota bacterium]
MKTLILAAGYGTRLYPLTKDQPKPLLPIGDKPLIDHLIEKVKNASDLSEVYVVTNDKFFEHFKDWASGKKDFSFPITIINDKTETPEDRLGSIGDIRFVANQHDIKEDLLVIGGDNLFDYALDEFLNFAKEQSDKVTVGLYDIKEKEMAKKFGVAMMNGNRNITVFEEKPAKPKTSLIAMCLYYMPVETLSLIAEYIKESGKVDLAGDYIKWLCQLKKLLGFQFEGKWYDIGSIEAYTQAQIDFRINS